MYYLQKQHGWNPLTSFSKGALSLLNITQLHNDDNLKQLLEEKLQSGDEKLDVQLHLFGKDTLA